MPPKSKDVPREEREHDAGGGYVDTFTYKFTSHKSCIVI